MNAQRIRGFLFGGILGSLAWAVPAAEPAKPVIQSMIGGVLFDDEHSYVAETTVELPLLSLDLFSLSFRHYEFTPVFREEAQTQLFYSRHDLEMDYQLGRHLRLLGVAGYHESDLEDRPGSLSSYTLGAGLGSALHSPLPWLEWSVSAGGYLSRQRLPSDWWADLHLGLRVFEFSKRKYMETDVMPSVVLTADVESSNDGGDFNALYKMGPVLEVGSGNGNEVRFGARWLANDGNPFFETDYGGMLLSAEVRAPFDASEVFDARDHRPNGWLPLVWGQYDVGHGGDRTLQRTELTAELHDLLLFNQLFTPVMWYESRQEYRPGDYDNVSYTASIGVQTRIGLPSIMSQGQPLVLGGDYLHRSAHSLDPDPDRVPASSVLPRNSINLGRVRVQTLGWDLPYRDPSIYQARTDWLHHFDWQVTLGYDFHPSRDRAGPSGRLGLNWDAATIQGSVLYARGLASVGNETPDWSGELGVRRWRGKLFFRYESYGLESHIAQGDTAVVGLGVHL